MKFLIVGLGNIGSEYNNTRHNIGFDVLDYVAEKFQTNFEPTKYATKASVRSMGKTFILLKPTTYMNLKW